MPTKRLPSNPSLEHLKHQAKDLLQDQRTGKLAALQRVREFHPRFHDAGDAAIGAAALNLADAQLAIAREYGFRSWARLKLHVENRARPDLELPHHERIDSPEFRQAVALLDDGDAEGLRLLLQDRPDLVRQRLVFEGGNYFQNPSLLEFVAENPVRHDSLPPNIVDVAKVILDAGARSDRAAIEATLALVSSGRVPRECGVQIALIDLLCDHGATPDAGMSPALGHGEFAAVEALIRRGAGVDLHVAAATGRSADARRLLPTSSAADRHLALALAAQHGHAEIVQLLLATGEDPNRYNPVGCHAHSTPLHQAAWAGHLEVVRTLVDGGARLDITDIQWNGTPLAWAEHGGRAEVAAFLRSRSSRQD